jgi:hypothetical protein
MLSTCVCPPLASFPLLENTIQNRPPCRLGSSLAPGYQRISWPSVPKTPSNSGPLCQCHSKFHSANPQLSAKFIPNSPRIIPRQTPFPPPYPSFTDFPSFTPYLISYPIYLMLLILYLMLLILYLMFVIPLIYVSFNKLNYQPY